MEPTPSPTSVEEQSSSPAPEESQTTEQQEVQKLTLKSQGTVKELKTTPEGRVFEYTSPTLGIQFTYVSPEQGAMHVLEQEDTVCVTYDITDTACEKGQSLQIFTKEEKQTLAAAITAQLLGNIPKAQCYVEPLTRGKYSRPRTTFTYAQISYPNKATNDDPFSLSTAKNCPEAYRAMNGIRYFAMDRKHPEKFIFFNIGQYAISSGEKDQTWDETVRFVVEEPQDPS